MKRKIPYGMANYADLIRDQAYFVDKTPYIAKLEQVNNPIFLRPRRFGKSLFCSMLRYYYDLNYADQFEHFFAQTWIGQHPTGHQNQYFILQLNFSTIHVGRTVAEIESSFRNQCNDLLDSLRSEYALLAQMPEIEINAPVSDMLRRVLTYIRVHKLPSMFVTIDEYDNFTNQLVAGNRDQLYRALTADDSFLKTFFKTLKEGRETGSIANVYITGVLPILIDDMASGFNIGSFLTLEPDFESMLGFTQREVDQLLDEVYEDYQIHPATRLGVNAIIKNHYDGYHFVSTEGEALYNSTILLYFLNWFTKYQTIPKRMTDLNLKTDISWVRRLTASDPKLTAEFVEQLTLHNKIAYDDSFLIEKFNMYQFFEKGYFPISFFYLGMLTKKNDFYLKLPNLNMRQIFVEYFNEIHHIDVSTRYAQIMQTFVNQPNLGDLFAGYWREYVSQLPEAIFLKVNDCEASPWENFYRTTFYELCRRYLSRWFTWNVERSYPSGKSDLEFVGKYHERFAGLRWVIEFKYFSNSEFKKLKTTIEKFDVRPEDSEQIAGYVEGLKKEYPEAQIAQFVIYCFGNQGFRVFAM